ncbi:MAG: GH25 family lysozyme [Anaerovoracaceae bacterium]|jgi:lysozyme
MKLNRKKKKKSKKKFAFKNIKIGKFIITPKAQKIAAGIIALLLIFGVGRLIATINLAASMPRVTGDNISYEIRGVDVSAYQGNIDWETLASQNISFAFIKATEGSTYVDNKFSTNWTNARNTDLRVGAYHFMSFETSGEKQAQNFIDTVEKHSDSLPPVIDIEYYGNYTEATVTQDTLDSVLEPLEKQLRSHYGKKPIIYTTPAIYKKFIRGNYSNDIWIADSTLSQLPGGDDWTFCQYSISGTMQGYSGGVSSIDLDVWHGSAFGLAAY